MSRTGSRPAAAIRTFGALPFARMIRTFQSPGLRKHPGVGLDDLFVTKRLSPLTLVNPLSDLSVFKPPLQPLDNMKDGLSNLHSVD